MKCLFIHILLLGVSSNLWAQAPTVISLEYARGTKGSEGFHFSVLPETDRKFNAGLEVTGTRMPHLNKIEEKTLLLMGPVVTINVTRSEHLQTIFAFSIKSNYHNEIFVIAPEAFLRQYFYLTQHVRLHFTGRLTYFPSKYLREIYLSVAAGISLSL